jgi:hypothetical protein
MLNFYRSRTMKRIKKAGRIALSVFALNLAAYVSEAQVGIGTMLPQERLHVHNGALLGTSDAVGPQNSPYSQEQDPIEFKMKWFQDKSAVRFLGERVGQTGLDKASIGNYSFASGFEVSASGEACSAFGIRTIAGTRGSFASGQEAVAIGSSSFAHGVNVKAIGHHNVAMGSQVETNGYSGCFIFGDNSGGSTKSLTDNQMMMRFSGGYRLYTNNNSSLGLVMGPGGSSWSVISDQNKKENFVPVNGEDFLQKISTMKLSSWNYKGQDPKTFRHYGPMAQDFYAAFGKDMHGTIGSDTTINQADFDGVNLIAIQALIHRMERINTDLRTELATIRQELATVKASAPGNEQPSDK